MTDIHRAEGIILNTINFQDFDQILTVFTQDEGLIKLIFKGANSSRRGKGSHTSPFTRAEFIYARGKSEIHNCKEISILNQHLRLRESLVKLEAACDLVHALTSSQMPHKPAPDLYKLLLMYLEKIALTNHPEAFAASFRLKVLRHDGLLGVGPECAVCRQPLESMYIFGGESFCDMHSPKGVLRFTAEEGSKLIELAYSRSIAQISSVIVEGALSIKVKQLFAEQIGK